MAKYYRTVETKVRYYKVNIDDESVDTLSLLEENLVQGEDYFGDDSFFEIESIDDEDLQYLDVDTMEFEKIIK